MAANSNFSVKSIDHIVLYVQSIQKSVEFYTKHLGMKHEEFSSSADAEQKRHALIFGNQNINLHAVQSPFEPHARQPEDGTADLCFLTDEPIDSVLSYLETAEIEVLEGGKVVDRSGAVGKLRSVYVRDPDGNLVEMSNYV